MPSRILVCGDSAIWGQGLEDHQKYSALVHEFLRAKWHGYGFDIERHTPAHSGAIIGNGIASGMELAIDPEVPVSDPTIFHQVIQYRDKPAEAADVALLLLNGGANDVNFRRIIDPTIDADNIRESTIRHCYEDMLALLTQCVQIFPNARIVVTGYYPIISGQTLPAFIPYLTASFGLMLAGLPGALVGGLASGWARENIITNCKVFAKTANLKLQEAVNEINRVLIAQGDQPRAAFAVPDFQPQHAFMAPDSYLFDLKANADPTEPFLPEDALLGHRVGVCHMAKDSGRIPDYRICKFASVGHPNVRGAQAYADAIIPILDNWINEGWRPETHNCPYNWLLLLLSEDDAQSSPDSWLPLLLSEDNDATA